MVDQYGIHVDPSKIETIKDWPMPKLPKKILQVLGLAGYYSRLIKNSLSMAPSLTALNQKDRRFEWGKKQEIEFQPLKQGLCEAPILALPEGNDDFIVYYDASRQGLGCVLLNKDVMDASRQLKGHEKDHTTPDLVFGTIVIVLRFGDINYIVPSVLYAYRAQKPPTHYNQKDLNLRQRR